MSVNARSPVSDARMPSLSSFFDTSKPGVSVGTRIWLMPACPPSSVVRASRQSQSAWSEFVMYLFDPLMTHSSPSRTARVRRAATSEPASGSVTAIAATASPRSAGARKRSFWSWVPKRASDGVAMSTCTPNAMPIAPWSARPISSASTTVKKWSAPPPPYSGSYSRPRNPSDAISRKTSWSGIHSASSQASTRGLISCSTNFRTTVRNWRCSSVNQVMVSPPRGARLGCRRDGPAGTRRGPSPGRRPGSMRLPLPRAARRSRS